MIPPVWLSDLLRWFDPNLRAVLMRWTPRQLALAHGTAHCDLGEWVGRSRWAVTELPNERNQWRDEIILNITARGECCEGDEVVSCPRCGGHMVCPVPGHGFAFAPPQRPFVERELARLINDKGGRDWLAKQEALIAKIAARQSYKQKSGLDNAHAAWGPQYVRAMRGATTFALGAPKMPAVANTGWI